MDARTKRISVWAVSVFWAWSAQSRAAIDPAQVKMSTWLWQQIDGTSKAALKTNDAIVYLKGEANLNGARDLLSKDEKGRFVYNALVKTAEISQKSLREYLTSKNISFDAHWIANLIVLHDASAQDLKDIAVRDDVLRVVGNPKVKQNVPFATVYSEEKALGTETSLSRIGADKVWKDMGVTGVGITIAGQDTGVQWDHPALKGHYRGWKEGQANHDYNWHDAIKKSQGGSSSCGYNNAAPCDDHDHGSHTVGTIVGDDGAGNQIGVAPGAKWIACRNMDAGIGTPASYLECFEYFLAPWKLGANSFKDGDPTKSPHVMNNSWGCPKDEGCEGTEFAPILKALEAAGIFVVASAGNDGPSCSTIKAGPAFNSANAFTVGAMNHRTNKIASFSSRGPSTYDNQLGPNVAAPGETIRSSVRGSKYASFGFSGTSMAGPHVVGVVALMWSANPKLIGQVALTRELLKKTAENKTEPGQTCNGVPGTAIPNNTWGYGVVNALLAVKAAVAQ